jgi:MFS family permease
MSTFGRSFTIATYVLYLRQHNLDYFTANLANVTFFVAMLLFELPTGAFADVFGRRAAFVASCLCWAMAGVVYGSSGTLPGFMAAEILGALGATLASGAFQAWFVDRLHHHGYEGNVLPFFFRERIWNTGATIVAGVLGAAVAAQYGREMVWFLETIALLIVALIALTVMKEEYFVPRRETLKKRAAEMRSAIKEGFGYGRSHPKIRFLFAIGLAMSFAVQAPNMQWQPIFQDLGVSQFRLGLAMAATQAMLFVGAALGLWASRRLRDEERLLRWTLGLAGVGIAATLLMPEIGTALSVFLMHELFRGAYQPVKDAYLNEQIPRGDSRRATILSFESLSRHTGGVIGLLVSGAVAQMFSPAAAWVSSGLLLVAVVIWLGRNGKST